MMKKLFSFGRKNALQPLSLPDGQETTGIANAKQPADPVPVAGENSLIKRYLACSNTGKMYVQTIKIDPDGKTAEIIDTAKLKKGEKAADGKSSASPEFTQYNFKTLYISDSDPYDGTCPFCINEGEYSCSKCGTISCCNSQAYPTNFKCPVCGLEVRLSGKTDFIEFNGVEISDNIATESLTEIAHEKKTALPHFVAGLLPKK